MSSNELTLISSYAALKATKPTEQGQRVLLTGWNEGTYTGGGYFVGSLVNRNVAQKYSDNGTIAHGKDYFWERVISDPSKLTIADFGAIADGVTDILEPALAMHKWSIAKYPGLGIQLPSGKFFLSRLSLPNDLNFFRLSGSGVDFGYFANTVIYTDTNPEAMIEVNCRWVELSNIQFVGTSTVDNPNKKGIFKNVIPGGQYFRANCVAFKKIGGTCMDLVDTLDTNLSQWYASECTGDVLVAKWSGQARGVWDHTTAVQLNNFNIQNCRGGKVFDLQRCTQSLMINGWIEHCDNPGDISNGYWTMIALSMEDCKNPLKAAFSRVTEINRSLQSGSWIDYSDDPALGRWLSEWERGRVDVQPYGIYVDGSLEPGTLMSRNKLSNNKDTPVWFRLGNFYVSGEGDSVDINMVGCGNMLSKGARLDDIDGIRQGGGNTLIRFQVYQNGGMGGTLQPCGSSPVLAAKYVKTGGGRFTVYVQLKNYSRSVIPMITSTSKTRAETGTAYYFTPDIKELTDNEMTAVAGTVDILEQWSIGHNAGIGATNEGHLMLKGKIVNNHLAVQVNLGTDKNPNVQVRYLQLKTEAK